jgi:hypothetical protein
MWGRFFESIGHDDTESVMSGSNMPSEPFPSRSSYMNLSQVQQSPFSEVHPNDSASVVDEGSVLDGYPKNGRNDVPSIMGADASIPVDDGTYVFKFRTPSGRTHRFQARNDNMENLQEIVSGKLASDPFFTEFQPKNEDDPIPDPLDFTIFYTDADGDAVYMTSDTDVTDAVKIARAGGTDRVVLFVQGGKGWNDAGANKAEEKAAEKAAEVKEEVKEVERSETQLPEGVHLAPPTKVHVPAEEMVMGIPKDLLLPASIGALAVSIIAVFAISRLTR